ncbi:MAG: GNAT family N-acetyltransferase [Candidatus Cloacimonetes bacterium]|nr:GNAT family N-acetyltransferase [Candidatus Cloacimonadota bacterium]
MSELKVRPIKKKRDIKRFILFPFSLYERDSCWVPPLIGDQMKFFNPTKNPYYDHSEVCLFLAERDGKIVGRITAHTNKQHNVFHQDKVGFFGFFECINDQTVSNELFRVASEWLKARGCDTIRGPMNLSVNDEVGLLVDGFATPPFVMMPYNHQYYEELILKAGLTKSKDLYAYHLISDKIPERLQRFADIITKKEEISVKSLAKNKKELKKDLETIFTLYRSAWERNWGFVPMTDKEFDHLVQTLLPILDPDLVFIAYYQLKPVGFSVALPDYNIILKKMNGRLLPFGVLKALYYKKGIKRLRVMVMGLLKEYQKRGIDGLFYYHTTKNGFAKGFNEGEFSWVLEDNIEMNNVAHKLGATIHKTYRIFDKGLPG